MNGTDQDSQQLLTKLVEVSHFTAPPPTAPQLFPIDPALTDSLNSYAAQTVASSMESILLKITPCLLDAGRLREAVAGISQEFMLMRDYTLGMGGGGVDGIDGVGGAVMAALIGFDEYFGSVGLVTQENVCRVVEELFPKIQRDLSLPCVPEPIHQLIQDLCELSCNIYHLLLSSHSLLPHLYPAQLQQRLTPLTLHSQDETGLTEHKITPLQK